MTRCPRSILRQLRNEPRADLALLNMVNKRVVLVATIEMMPRKVINAAGMARRIVRHF